MATLERISHRLMEGLHEAKTRSLSTPRPSKRSPTLSWKWTTESPFKSPEPMGRFRRLTSTASLGGGLRPLLPPGQLGVIRRRVGNADYRPFFPNFINDLLRFWKWPISTHGSIPKATWMLPIVRSEKHRRWMKDQGGSRLGSGPLFRTRRNL